MERRNTRVIAGWRLAIAFAGALAVACASACSKADQDQTSQAISRSASDVWLCAQVRAKATELDPATVSLIKVSCTKGFVSMAGQVRSTQEREQLEEAVGKIDGVKGTAFIIAVNPKAPTGNEIADNVALEAKVRLALAGQTGVNAFKLHVSAHHGVVTLTGSVPSASLRTVARDTARGVHGVKGVVDDLSVER